SIKPPDELTLSTQTPALAKGSPKDRLIGTEAGPSAMRFHARHVSVGEFFDEYFAVEFDSEGPGDDDFALSGDGAPYLILQRQFEDADGGVCYIETHDHDTYSGHFRLRLIRFTPTRLAFEIARKDHKYVEVTYDLDARRFEEVRRIVHIIFGVQG
ncbi:MAG TPA: hypothetical protein VHQ03_06590, partial [Candidatus Dormibacteraeota bacterium]|nr:hypothetical protein [Candidatus Dormibacteraeota bacterium]